MKICSANLDKKEENDFFFLQPPLLQAIFHGNVEAIRTLLSQKEDVNWQDKEQRSLLHAAAYRSISQLIKC